MNYREMQDTQNIDESKLGIGRGPQVSPYVNHYMNSYLFWRSPSDVPYDKEQPQIQSIPRQAEQPEQLTRSEQYIPSEHKDDSIKTIYCRYPSYRHPYFRLYYYRPYYYPYYPFLIKRIVYTYNPFIQY